MKTWNYIYGVLLLAAISVWISVLQKPDDKLHIIACDVGQGDAILITYQNTQILTDGGPNKKVLDCLSKYIPFYDREIELVILTHPDADHSTGLIDVTKRYNIDTLLTNPIDPGTETYRVLANSVGSRGIEVLTPYEGMSMRLGLIYLDIYNPNSNMVMNLKDKISENKMVMYEPIEDTNSYSIVYRLSFKNFTGLFTGDIGPDESSRLASENKIGEVDYIKIPHHGSRNGMTQDLLKTLMPKVAVISVGEKNRYGHPSPEVIDILNSYKVRVLRTDEMGDVEISTDGESIFMNP